MMGIPGRKSPQTHRPDRRAALRARCRDCRGRGWAGALITAARREVWRSKSAGAAKPDRKDDRRSHPHPAAIGAGRLVLA